MDRSSFFAFILLLIFAGPGCKSDVETVNKQPQEAAYGDEVKPGAEPVVFARGIVSSPDAREMGCSMAPGCNEFFFVRDNSALDVNSPAIWVTKVVDGKWAAPEMISFTGVNSDFAPFVTFDNKHLLFFRMAPQDVESDIQSGTWISERTADGWSEPTFLVDAYCTSTADFETFYFGFGPDAPEGREVGCVKRENGEFTGKRVLPGQANSPEWEAHPCISPDGTYIMFDSQRPGGFSEFDMWVSYRQEDGTWGVAENLGPEINGGHRSMPSISPDGKFLFFSADDDIWWVSLDGKLNPPERSGS